jgi:hypothetical protein
MVFINIGVWATLSNSQDQVKWNWRFFKCRDQQHPPGDLLLPA